MMRRLSERLVLGLVLGTGLCALAGCERDASGLTEWTPADHDHQTEPKGRRNASRGAAPPASPHAAPSKRDQVIDVTWAKQCATCHGKRGRGDGPSSTMVKARDLSNPEWQASVSDEQLTKVIREGKDKMPAFNLPDNVIDGLVKHVRDLVRKPKAGAAPSEAAPGEAEDETSDSESAGEAPAEAPNAPASAAAKEPAAAAPASPDKPAQAPTAAPAPAPSH